MSELHDIARDGKAHLPPPRLPLEEVRALIRTYMIVGDHELDFLALWVVHTWAFEAAETTPYARIESAERSSGKTRLLEVLEPLVRRGLMVLTPTYSVVRAIDAECPTVLIDEIDQLDLNEQRELLAVMNAGFRLGPTVPRWNKERQELEHLDPFGPKCFAGLKKGRLPDTLISRSVPVELRRRLPTERVEPKFARDVEARAEPLAKAMKRWAEANHEKLAHAWPAFPEGLGDRECEVWLPLLNIADLVGGDWPKRAREAAVALSGNVEGEESRGVRLLTDIKDVFATQGDPDAIFSADLVEALNALEEASWGAWNNGEGMRQRDLAKILKPYAISPHEVRIGDATKRAIGESSLWTLGRAMCVSLRRGEQARQPRQPQQTALESQISSATTATWMRTSRMRPRQATQTSRTKTALESQMPRMSRMSRTLGGPQAKALPMPIASSWTGSRRAMTSRRRSRDGWPYRRRSA
jgi:hypothetical protein